MKKRSLGIFELIWALVMVAVISSTLTLLLAGRFSDADATHWVSGEDYEKIQRYNRLDEVREMLMENYYRELDEETLVLGAIRGMTQSIEDPYTFYYTPDELTASNETSEGNYHGIGILVQRNDEGFIEVLRVYEGSPARESGLRVGDIIVAVDGYEIDGVDEKSYNEAISRIRGEDGTQVELTIRRDYREWNVLVLRSNVNINYASYQMLDDGIGYVSITQFTGDASERFMEALDYFKSQNAKGMIIDVRSNPGGLLTEVMEIADAILPEGVVVYTQDREGRREDYFSDEKYYDVPLVVLVNESSASASEVLAGAVKAFDRGIVVGMNTYGKGIVQTLTTFDEDGAGVQMTTSSYYSGDGKSIHGIGVEPDIPVALDGEYTFETPDLVSDNQLNAALDAIKEMIK